ncbi:MAG: hypothetical protein AAFX65_07725 [Cyanobacteria bacterium J06638_7]
MAKTTSILGVNTGLGSGTDMGSSVAERGSAVQLSPELRARQHRQAGLSYVAETADGCRIYRQTNGLYAVCGAGTDKPARPAATLAGAYAVCQEMAGSAGWSLSREAAERR